MKKILGSWLFFTTVAWASYTWEMTVSKTQLYTGESFLVTLICRFEDEATEMFIELDPQAESFSFKRLDVSDRLIDQKRTATYRYVAKALKAGSQKLVLEPLMRKTTQASIKERTIGRDNVQRLVFDDTKVRIRSKTLEVKPQDIPILGSFTYTQTLSKSTLAAFEPLQLKIEIEGVGDLDAFDIPQFDLDGVTVYVQKPQKLYRLTPKGYEGKVIFTYALISDANFTLPSREVKVFNPYTAEPKFLGVQAMAVEVGTAPSIEMLVDPKESPQEAPLVEWRALVGYGIFYLLGMLSTFLWLKYKHRVSFKTTKKVFQTIPELVGFLIEHPTPQSKALLEQIEADAQAKRLKKVEYYAKEVA